MNEYFIKKNTTANISNPLDTDSSYAHLYFQVDERQWNKTEFFSLNCQIQKCLRGLQINKYKREDYFICHTICQLCSWVSFNPDILQLIQMVASGSCPVYFRTVIHLITPSPGKCLHLQHFPMLPVSLKRIANFPR